MLRRSSIFIVILFLISLSAVSGQTVEEDMIKSGLSVFKDKVSLIDFTLPDLNGKTTSLKDYRGKVVMLNFWATWCPPCRREMPSMENLYNIINKDKIDIVAVNIQEKAKTVSDFVSKNNYTFPVLVDEEGKAASIYQIRSIPTTFIIDKKGYLRAMITGSIEWDKKEIISIFTKLSEE